VPPSATGVFFKGARSVRRQALNSAVNRMSYLPKVFGQPPVLKENKKNSLSAHIRRTSFGSTFLFVFGC
jgi:hypothetical protein